MKSSTTLSIFIIIVIVCGSPWAQDDFEYVSSSLFHDHFESVVKYDNYAYCGGENGLQVIDVSDSNTPVFANCIRGNYMGTLALSVGNDGPRLCSIDGNSLWVIGIFDPTNPIALGEYQTGLREIRCFDVDGDIAYIAAESSSYYYDSFIEVIDVSDPESPYRLSRTSAHPQVTSLDAVDGFVYTTYNVDLNPSGFQIFDATNPANVFLTGSLEYEYFLVWTAVAYEDYAFLASYDGIMIVDIQDRSNPYVIDTIDLWWPENLKVFEHYLFMYFNSTICVLDIADPVNPVPLSEYSSEYSIRSLYLDDDILYYSGINGDSPYLSALNLIDYTDPYSPVFTGRYNVPGEVKDVQLFDNYAFIANGFSGLQLINVADPYNPVLGDNVGAGGWAVDIVISSSYAYLANFDDGLSIFDLSNPEEPIEIGFFDTTDVTIYVDVEGEYAYLINAREGMYDYHILILDVSDPSNPILVDTYEELYTPRYIRVVDNIAYVSCLYSLEIIEMTDPTAPVHLASHPYRNSGAGLFVEENYVYVTGWPNGLDIYDVSDPENPLLVGVLDSLPSGAVAVNDGYAYLSRWHHGLYLVDISDPTEPTLVSSYADASSHNEVFVRGEYIYVAAEDCFLILTLTPTGLEQVGVKYPSTLNLAQNYPNPFNASTTIEYSLPQDSEVMIEIYDILGRKVETLVVGKQPAGSHSALWEAKDVSSGVYFYRIEAGEYSQTQRCVLLK